MDKKDAAVLLRFVKNRQGQKKKYMCSVSVMFEKKWAFFLVLYHKTKWEILGKYTWGQGEQATGKKEICQQELINLFRRNICSEEIL